MITELLKIAEAEVKPLVLEAQIIYTGLQLQKQLGKDNFRVVNKGIETNNLKTDFQMEIKNPDTGKFEPFNIEIKAKDGQFGSITINELNFNDGKYNIKNNIENAEAIDMLLSGLDTKAFQKHFISCINSVSKKTDGDIVSIDGKTLGKYAYENRTPVKYKDLPLNLIQDVLCLVRLFLCKS